LRPPKFAWEVVGKKKNYRKLDEVLVQKSGVHQFRLVVHPMIYRALYIPGGPGFLPATVLPWDIPNLSNSIHLRSMIKLWCEHPSGAALPQENR